MDFRLGASTPSYQSRPRPGRSSEHNKAASIRAIYQTCLWSRTDMLVGQTEVLGFEQACWLVKRG